MTFLLFFVLSHFNLEARAEDTKLPTKTNPTVDYQFFDGPNRGQGSEKNIVYNTVVVNEARDKIIPSLNDKTTCRSIRDSIINLCSKKTDPTQSFSKQVYKIDPKEEALLSEEIKKMAHVIINNVSENNSKKSLDCKNKLENFNKIVDSSKFEEFLRSIHSNEDISSGVLMFTRQPKYTKIFSFFGDFRNDVSCNVVFNTELYTKLVQLKDIQYLNKHLIDMWNFDKASPCESIKVDYDSEGDLCGIKVVKRNELEPITYNIQLKNTDYSFNPSKKDSSFCIPDLTIRQDGKPLYSSNRIGTEFDKELSVILNRAKAGVSAKIMTTPSDVRPGLANPDAGAEK